jgi:hypothetical protein
VVGVVVAVGGGVVVWWGVVVLRGVVLVVCDVNGGMGGREGGVNKEQAPHHPTIYEPTTWYSRRIPKE